MSKTSTLNFANVDVASTPLGQGLGWSIPESWSLPKPWSVLASDDWKIGPISVVAQAGVEGGLSGGIHATAGKYDLSYPLIVNSTFNNAVNNGSVVTIDTSNFSVNDPKINSTGPGVGADINF